MNDQKFKRLNVNFAFTTYETLERLSKESGKSMSEVLREAIALEAWVHDAKREGGRILVERDGVIRELLIR